MKAATTPSSGNLILFGYFFFSFYRKLKYFFAVRWNLHFFLFFPFHMLISADVLIICADSSLLALLSPSFPGFKVVIQSNMKIFSDKKKNPTVCDWELSTGLMCNLASGSFLTLPGSPCFCYQQVSMLLT